jgi:hypothetical protein
MPCRTTGALALAVSGPLRRHWPSPRLRLGGSPWVAKRRLILGAAGGSPADRPRLGKQPLQALLADRRGAEGSIGQPPTGASPWNPLAPRRCEPLSVNGPAEPPVAVDQTLAVIRGTVTDTGRSVEAFLVAKLDATRRKVTPAVMKRLNVVQHPGCPRCNATLRPRSLDPLPIAARWKSAD